MNISRDNYESWFLDYLEGRLNKSQTEVLVSFLEFNPDLKKELRGLETVRLEAEDTCYDLKFTLKKPDATPDRQEILGHFEEYCLLGIEQQLNAREEKILQEILQNDPARRKTFELYRSTLLCPPQKIRYPRKSRLKKSILLVPRVRIAVSAAAAAVLVFLGLSLLVWNRPVYLSDTTSPSAAPEAIPNDAAVLTEAHAHPGPPYNLLTQKAVKPETGIPTKPDRAVSEETIPLRETVSVKGVAPMGFIPLEYPVKPGGSLSGDNYPIQATQLASSPQQLELKTALWALADAGIQRINERSEEYFSLEREAGRNGLDRRLTFETQWFGISAPLRSADGRQE